MARIKKNLIITREKCMRENNPYSSSIVQDHIFIFKKFVIDFYDDIYH